MTEKIFQNVTHYCYVGEQPGGTFPKTAVPCWNNTAIPPQRLARIINGPALEYHLLNHPLDPVSFRGPKDKVDEELKALEARGATGRVVTSEVNGVVEGTIRGLRYVVEDVSSQHKGASESLLADPNLVSSLASAEKDNAALRAENEAMKAKLAKLEAEEAKRIPGKSKG